MSTSSIPVLQITSTGASAPSYTDILNAWISVIQSIFGSDFYLATDSKWYQFLAILSSAMNDYNQAGVAVYNAFSPSTAQGTGLSSNVKINGLARLVASNSTVEVELVGQAGTVITNGIVQDASGNLWDLLSSVTIPSSGSITVTATAEQQGTINASAGTVTIYTPTAGWQSATFISSATTGNPVEDDAELRARQSISTALPSETIGAGTVAGVMAVSGVTSLGFYENPTASTSDGSTVNGYAATVSLSATNQIAITPLPTLLPSGLPQHSITCVVLGGADADVAQAIYNNRGLGPFTNGTTTVVVTDSVTGVQMNVSFYRPTSVPIYVTLGIHGFSGYTTATATAIQNAVVNYLNSLAIGEIVSASAISAAAMAVNPNLSSPLFSIRSLTLGTSASPSGTSDISMLLYQVSQGSSGNIVINPV